MIAPGWLDTLLARRAIGGQESEEPAERGHADNLFSPVPGRYGAHGRFDRAARVGTLQVDPGTIRQALAWTAAGLALGAFACSGRRTSHSDRKIGRAHV